MGIIGDPRVGPDHDNWEVRVRSGLVCALCLVSACNATSPSTRPVEDQATALDLTLENIHGSGAGARGVILSPDGARVAISGSGPEGSGVYLAELGDLPAQPRLWLQGSSPSWAPTGDRIVFTRGGEVWIASTGDSEGRAITTDMAGARAPSFSPDSRTVAFYSARSGNQDIWLVAADGSSPPRQLTDAAMSVDDPRFAPGWSPDSRSIAYVSNASDYWHDDIWVVDAESGARRQVSRSLMAMSSPVWSPDGTRIAVFGTAKDEYWYEDLAYIYLIDPRAGTEGIVEMQVYATDASMRHAPSWSGDGRSLYFPYMERGRTNVWAVPVEGGVATRITNLDGSLSSLHVAPAAGTSPLFTTRRSTGVRSTPSMAREEARNGLRLSRRRGMRSRRHGRSPTEASTGCRSRGSCISRLESTPA